MLVLSFLALAAHAHPGSMGSDEGCMMRLFQDTLSTRTLRGQVSQAQAEAFQEALKEIDFAAVKTDLIAAMTDSQDFWPADYGNYGPLWVRLAWHCAGSYRASDGRGGCDGGRQRFDPERSWDDNTNLDKARRTLVPIKEKYGHGLSWGDLIILAGTTAIEAMGGPTVGICLGRVDDVDGTDSVLLDPTAPAGYQKDQQGLFPCPDDQVGLCAFPLGTQIPGLIYVNPGGPLGEPNPAGSVADLRNVFARMSMNDTETVALSGGGHAFGKVHGACPDGPGPRPSEDQRNPWPGNCGTGQAEDTFTSGFEGPWTHTPFEWSNNYYMYLHQNTFSLVTGPGGANQWRATGGPEIPLAPAAFGNGKVEIRMLTSDVALQHDPIYKETVARFATDLEELNKQFSEVWYKLTTRDMGPASRCFNADAPAARPFQAPLPMRQEFSGVNGRYALKMAEDMVGDLLMNPSKVSGVRLPSYLGKTVVAGPLVNLALACASTFRRTDYMGGCNGARVRMSPEKDFNNNRGVVDLGMAILQPIHDELAGRVSMADLIVLAGSKALEFVGAGPMPVCGGRVDAPMSEDLGVERKLLESLLTGEVTNTIGQLNFQRDLWGLTNEELVALIGGAHSINVFDVTRGGFLHGPGFIGSSTSNPNELNNEYFKSLLSNDFVEFTVPRGKMMYINKGGLTGQSARVKVTEVDLMLKYDQLYRTISVDFASDNDYFLRTFKKAFIRFMNADRYAGPVDNECSMNTDLIHVVGSEKEMTEDPEAVMGMFLNAQEGEYFSSSRAVESVKEAWSLISNMNMIALFAGYGAIGSAVVYALVLAVRKKETYSALSEQTPLRAA